MSAPERAPLGAALALLMCLVSLTGPLSPVLMAVAIGALALLLAIAWPELLELPSPLGTRIVVAACGLGAAGTALWENDRIAPMTAIVMICGAGVLASFVHQMLRRGRHQLTASLTGTVSGVFLATIAACWVLAQAAAVADGTTGVITALTAGLASALLLNVVPAPSVPRLVAAVLAGAGVTVLVGMTLTGLGPPALTGMGLVAAIGATAAQLLLGSSLVSGEPVPSLAPAAGSVATVGVVAYVAVVALGA